MLLQHREIDAGLLPRVLREAPAWTDMEGLARAADAAVAQLRALRRMEARRLGGLRGLAVRVDDWLRTDAPEHLDDPYFPPARKEAIVQSLHRFNQGVLAYHRFFRVLRPMLADVAAAHRRPVRVLELASGSGEFALALDRLARRAGLAVEVTGSDYLRAHVEVGNGKALARRAPVRFRELNAFDLSVLAPGDFDLVFVAQSIHHFTPGQVAMMVAQATRVATVGFVGIDGRRSPELFAVVPAAGLLFRSRDYLHDAVVTLRKFYTESELELIARLAVPDGFVSARPELPGYSVLMATR